MSGMGNTCCTKPEHLDDIPADKTLQWHVAGKSKGLRGAFTTITVPDLSSGLSIGFFDQDGEALYSVDAVRPRAQSVRKNA